MKKIVLIGSLSLLLMSAHALAEWVEVFEATVLTRGEDEAVIAALQAGASPADIVALVEETGGAAPTGVIKGLYCAGVSGTTVQAAATQAGLAESVVAAGFQQSVQQCGPAGGLKPDPFSRTSDVASGGTTYRGQGGPPPGTPPGGGVPPPVILPPVDGGNGQRPPSASPSRPN